ncbi:iap3 [Leucania separata nucleopolyhedrovirus]|uniref:Iap3 n=1 Tax=Leucania separata nucleopolyhedrovirus TaxID=1307956 RepID=Q0IL79_NPVLS|nr:iap3 [Leucania separata nucleopolyhedrovirus]AAR28804.1 iap3 [Leucania separata nucleopolyhedrovirus]
MDSLEARLKTFDNSPFDEARAKELALCQFYSTGNGDEVRCHVCSLEINKWQPGESAFEKHFKCAPFCRWVKNETRVGVTIPCRADLKTEHARLVTYKYWPKSMKQTPQQLAEAGFYYSGTGDQVKCFFCGGGLKDWEPADDPWAQHARWFDRCAYVLTVKGADYVQRIASESVEHKQDEEQQQQPDDDEPSATGGDESKLCKICFDAVSEVCFVPCGHVVSCGKCAFSVNTCPMCRKQFDRIIRVYYS